MAGKGSRLHMVWTSCLLVTMCIVLVASPAGIMAGPPTSPPSYDAHSGWDPAAEDKSPTSQHDLIPYPEIGPTLYQIESTSNRVRVDVMGQSAGGHDLFLVTLTDPESMGRLGRYQALRHFMLEDPEKAQEMIDQFEDFKVPVFINASVHGTEPEGVDAAIELIRTLAYEDSEEVQAILDHVILLINVVANPDGRVLNQRSNVNGFDLNRDFITQSQPETRATVHLLTEWNPMVLLDLHGYMNPMLIEPCTPPHNPNYEYDLYIKWALGQAEAMEAELLAQTGLAAQIPYRDSEQGWDDWAPIYTPMYAMYHGAYAHTLETPFRGERGVSAHYAAVWGALKFIAENKKDMIWDQVEIFKRGFLDFDQIPISDELLNETPYDQYSDLTTIDFPAAYVIPEQMPLQQNVHQAARLVDFLIFNDIQVAQATQAFQLKGISYPSGTYIVWMNQPKRGLANTMLWDGWDISYDPGLDMYDISSWSHPHLWGVTREVMEDENKVDVTTTLIENAVEPEGWVQDMESPAAYAYLPTSNQAILATNQLLRQGVALSRATQPFQDSGRDFGTGTFILPPNADLADQAADQYRLQVFGLETMPEGISSLSKPRIAVNGSEGTLWFLNTYGFDFDSVSSESLNGNIDLTGYDIFVCQSTLSSGQATRATLEAFFAAGGDYIGIGSPGVDVSIQFNLSPGVAYNSQSGNGIVKVAYDPTDPVSAQYPADSYAFVYQPTFFTDPGQLEVSASMKAADDFFVSGFWWDWKNSGAAGKPVILNGTVESSRVTLIGIDPTFRAHPEHTFRILANAIYSSLD